MSLSSVAKRARSLVHLGSLLRLQIESWKVANLEESKVGRCVLFQSLGAGIFGAHLPTLRLLPYAQSIMRKFTSPKHIGASSFNSFVDTLQVIKFLWAALVHAPKFQAIEGQTDKSIDLSCTAFGRIHEQISVL